MRPPLREYQKFRVMRPECPICNETCISRVIEDYGRIKYVRMHNQTAWITRSHRKEFTIEEKRTIEYEMMKRIGTALIEWGPPSINNHAYAIVLNTQVTKGMLRVAKVARDVLKE